MDRLEPASRIAFITSAFMAMVGLAVLLAGCGGAEDTAAPSQSALLAPQRQAFHVQPQVPDANTLMDWAEGRFAEYFPGHKTTLSLDIYLYRFYPETGLFLAVGGQEVLVLPVGGQVLRVGTLADFACHVFPASCLAASSLHGQTLYQTALGSAGNACRDCHGATPGAPPGFTAILKAAGPQDSQGIPSIIRAAINNNQGGVMGQFSGVTDAQLADIAAYVNATVWSKPLQ